MSFRPILWLSTVCAGLLPALSMHAQSTLDPDSIPPNAFIWNQEQIEVGFRHYDRVFPAREVPNGDHVHEFPVGEPIAAFEEGGEKAAFFNTYIEEQKVAGLLVIHHGNIRLERYALGHSREGRFTSQSVGKSFTSTLVGAAIRDGHIRSVNDHVSEYLPGLRGSAYDSITIHQLLSMTTGVRWTEVYDDPNTDIVQYYVKPIEPGLSQAVNYMKDLPAEVEPGSRWKYNTGETNLLGVLVSQTTGKTLSAYLSEKIWIPYGMEQPATWLVDRTEHELAGCCIQMTTRDFGRYGQLVLDDGVIGGESIVPDDWFATATHSQAQLWGFGYGYQWWTFPDGSFRAQGIHGQMIHIDPKRDLVVVVNSCWPEAENMQRQMRAFDLMTLIGELVEP